VYFSACKLRNYDIIVKAHLALTGGHIHKENTMLQICCINSPHSELLFISSLVH